MSNLIYKINSNFGWYRSHSDLGGKDHSESPIYLNKKRAEKYIRDRIRWAEQLLARPDFDALQAPWVPLILEQWKTAYIVTFELIEVKE